jgi:hypothetical protein
MTPRRALPVLFFGVLLLAALPGAAQAGRSAGCPAQRGTLAHDGFGRVWHQGASLYGCTTVYGRRPRSRRLGPWRPGAKVAWDGSDAVWSVPLTRGGEVVGDRVYAADAQDGTRWLLGARALPAAATAGAGEARVQRVFAHGATAAWVTTGGAVVFALRSPEDDPAAEGALGATPVADGHLTLVGTWTGRSPTDLGRTLAIDSAGGDGDECGGSEEYRLTVVPDAGSGARVGVRWLGGWSRPFCG